MAVEVNGEMAAILQSSRFSPDFDIQISDKPDKSGSESTPQVAIGLLKWLKCFYFERLATDCIQKGKLTQILHCKNPVKHRFLNL